MARGHQKIQSQQKAQEAAAKRKKAEGHSAKDQKAAASAALKTKCSVCMVRYHICKFGFGSDTYCYYFFKFP